MPSDVGKLKVLERKTRSGKHVKFEIHAPSLKGRKRVGVIYQLGDGDEGVEESRAIAERLVKLWNENA